MRTNQQIADDALLFWQTRKDLTPEDRIEALIAQSMLSAPVTEAELDITLNNVALEMSCV